MVLSCKPPTVGQICCVGAVFCDQELVEPVQGVLFSHMCTYVYPQPSSVLHVDGRGSAKKGKQAPFVARIEPIFSASQVIHAVPQERTI